MSQGNPLTGPLVPPIGPIPDERKQIRGNLLEVQAIVAQTKSIIHNDIDSCIKQAKGVVESAQLCIQGSILTKLQSVAATTERAGITLANHLWDIVTDAAGYASLLGIEMPAPGTISPVPGPLKTPSPLPVDFYMRLLPQNIRPAQGALQFGQPLQQQQQTAKQSGVTGPATVASGQSGTPNQPGQVIDTRPVGRAGLGFGGAGSRAGWYCYGPPGAHIKPSYLDDFYLNSGFPGADPSFLHSGPYATYAEANAVCPTIPPLGFLFGGQIIGIGPPPKPGPVSQITYQGTYCCITPSQSKPGCFDWECKEFAPGTDISNWLKICTAILGPFQNQLQAQQFYGQYPNAAELDSCQPGGQIIGIVPPPPPPCPPPTPCPPVVGFTLWKTEGGCCYCRLAGQPPLNSSDHYLFSLVNEAECAAAMKEVCPPKSGDCEPYTFEQFIEHDCSKEFKDDLRKFLGTSMGEYADKKSFDDFPDSYRPEDIDFEPIRDITINKAFHVFER